MDEITAHETAVANAGTQAEMSPEQMAQQLQPESTVKERTTNEPAMESLEVAEDPRVRSKLRIYTIFIALCVLCPIPTLCKH